MSKNIDWSNLGFGYMKTDLRYVSMYRDGKWDEGVMTADNTVTISARSHDKINVQIIMQRLGGGGHYDMAGARLTHTTLEAACMQLKTVLDEYMDTEYEEEKGGKR